MHITMAVNNNNQLHIYQRALSCLSTITIELNNNNVDSIKLNKLYHECTTLIQDLRQDSNNPHIISSLESLLSTLSLQQSLLEDRRHTTSKPPAFYSSDRSEKTSDASKDRYSLVKNMLITPQNNRESLNNVVGLEQVKDVIREAFIMPTQYPHLFTGSLKPWKRLLMYGPPGTGKTKIAMAVAAELNCPFYCVTMSNLLSSWIGESEKILQELFSEARQHGTTAVIFFDEIDCLCRTRSQGENEHTRRLKTELLREIEGHNNNDNVFILATTNCPWDLDPAFTRRFQQRVFVPLPDRESRLKIIQQCNDNILFTSNDWDVILDLTEGYSGADINHLTMAAAFIPIRELQSSHFWKFVQHDKIMPCSSDTLGAMQMTFSSLPAHKVIPRPVSVNDFITASKSTKATVTTELMDKYKEFQ